MGLSDDTSSESPPGEKLSEIGYFLDTSSTVFSRIVRGEMEDKVAPLSPLNFLIPVDDSSASEKALAYLAALAKGLPAGSLAVTLFHLLPLPPRLVEHGGAENPTEEQKRERDLAKDREIWLEEARESARPLLAKAAAVLRRANVPDEKIHEQLEGDVHHEIAREALEAARANGCGTIVVGRDSFPWYKELTRTHVADELVRRANEVAVCVVQ